MPTYEYVCTTCGEGLEAVQKFSDPPLAKCPNCKGKLRKVFSPVGVVFKGSGFYKTDSRSGSKSASGAGPKESGAGKEAASTSSSSDSSSTSSSSDNSKSDSSGGGTSAKSAESASKSSKKDGGSKVA